MKKLLVVCIPLVIGVVILSILETIFLSSIQVGSAEVSIKNSMTKENQEVIQIDVKDEKIKEASIDIDDNKQIGILIMSQDGDIYHTSLEFKSASDMKLDKNNVGEKIALKIDSEKFSSDKVELTSTAPITVDNDKKYNGKFVIYKTKKGMVLINKIKINEYLYSVVPSEMPSSYHKEALKAQAICARTYTYAHMENEKYNDYEAIMDDTVNYQAYGQFNTSKKVEKAVDETKNTVLTYNGELINAYYFSTSCGFTTDSKIWGDDIDYLKSKFVSSEEYSVDVSTADYFAKYLNSNVTTYESNYPYYRWNVNIPKKNIRTKLVEYKNVDVGKIKDMYIIGRGAGGIVSKLTIVGNNKTIELNNQNEIRNIFSPKDCPLYLNDGTVNSNMSMLPSGFFTLEMINKECYINGGGFGHGCGMSQNGANAMAQADFKAMEILEFYYNGVTDVGTNND